MKKLPKILLAISCLVIFFAPGLVSATATKYDYNYSEQIDNFAVNIDINNDSSIEVTERIDYNFGSLQRHGIYRYIPYKYKARGGNFSLRFSDISVEDENGASYNYEKSQASGNINLKIGDADKYITGKHTYIIKYRVERALNYFDEWDELYWNATGTEWDVPIIKSQATVSLPADIAQKDLKTKCFTGSFGSTLEECRIEKTEAGKVTFMTDGELSTYQGLTIVLGWPKSIVFEPSTAQKAAWVIWDNISLGIAPLVFIFAFLYWYTRGRDPKIKGAVVAEYETPEKLSPLELGALYKDRISNKYISAELIDLAIKGYIKIIQTGKGRKDYKFTYRKDYSDLKNDYDKRLLEYVFDGEHEVAMSDLEYKFYRHIGEIKKLVFQKLTAKQFYSKNPQRARFGLLFVLAILSLFSAFILGPIFQSFILGASIFVSGVILLIFSMLMPKRTKQGTEVLRKIQGFKLFLEVTEEERLKFHNPPKMIPEVFERFLPYAMVLGVETKWAKNFEKIYTEEPDWYQGHQVSAWNAVFLANSLSTFSTRSSSIMAAAPSSNASGGSGFSGGGFSGGGGGGGGGGSW